MRKVGEFISDGSSVFGPKDYMSERGSSRLGYILSGNDTVFNAGCQHSPDPVTAVLVSLQTDYAAWKGMQTLGG